MKLQFEPNQGYQLNAINAVVDIFAGQPMDADNAIEQYELVENGGQMSLENASARGNKLLIKGEQLIENVHNVQKRHNLPLSETESGGVTMPAVWPIVWGGKTLDGGNNFTVEMETGTGKTYVYLRTMHELHAKYGFKKFIIVVPGVAIKEGVLKNLEITQEHFANLYNKPEMDYYVWDTKKRGQARQFATNDTLQVMVITIDSFAKAENVINKASDWGTPIDYIRATNPIVIMDEPQNMETEKRKDAIESLNPLCILRYSATHKQTPNLLYKLDPVKAYDLGLVKKIEVDSVYSEDSFNTAYVSLVRIERKGKSGLIAHVEIDKDDARGLQRKVVKLESGTDLRDITGRLIYNGYILDEINIEDESIEFTNGQVFYLGQKNEGLHEEILKYQIERTIENHFEKERRLAGQGIKVLSLFFIDKVANYREYTEAGHAKGKFAIWFEELYEKVSQKQKYAELAKFHAKDVHNGYFAQDKSGHWKNSSDTKGEGGKTSDDNDAYHLIMQAKEKLLEVDRPLRFIFTHSALREGWDNPNVFNICTLNETSSEMKKRQEIGRGLRLPVDTNGVRIRDESVNILTIVANESYEDFSRKLQTEIEDDTGVSFAGRVKKKQDRKSLKLTKRLELDPSFKELWDKIKYKTRYSVEFDSVKLVEKTTELLDEVTITKPRIVSKRTRITKMSDNFVSEEKATSGTAVQEDEVSIPDILGNIQARTKLTRRTVYDVLDKSNLISKILINPEQVIDEVSIKITLAMRELMVDGIKYERIDDVWDMQRFEKSDLEVYLYDQILHSGAIAVDKSDKTVYDYVDVDSEIEYNFMKSLETNDDIRFYLKLPAWFVIDTPLGTYNPDWAIVFENDIRIYFVAETKGSDDLYANHISDIERGKIKSARVHFKTIGTKYAAPVASLESALKKALQDK